MDALVLQFAAAGLAACVILGVTHIFDERRWAREREEDRARQHPAE